MSDFDDASLVLIPSGYKNGKVYSVKPTDGTGDLTFTRASSATRVQSDGLIEKVRTNLVLQSETFDNASWVKNTTTVVANAETAPDGTLTAETMTVSTSDSRVDQTTILTAGTYTFSVYVKVISQTTAGTMRLQALVDAANVSVVFTPTTEWQRFTATYTATATLTSVRIRGQAFVGTLAIWGAQLEVSDFGATDYIPTTTAAVSVGPVSGLPRLDYLGSTCPRLLLEPQRTNLQLNSESFDNATWTKVNSVVTANQIVSPDGNVNADKLDETTANSIHQLEGSRTVTVAAYTMSVFAKKGERNFVRLYEDTTSNSAYFNLNTGAIGTVSGLTATAKIENYGNGWYRCSVTYTETGTFGRYRIVVAKQDNETSYAGTAGYGIYTYGAQYELGAYATSYIPTLGASVTRVADAASKTGISSLIGQTEGTLFTEVDFTQTGTEVYILSLTSAGSDTISLRRLSTGEIRCVFSAATSSGTTNGSSAILTNGRYKLAYKYISGSIKLFVNGALSFTLTPTFTFGSALSDAFLGMTSSSTGQLSDGMSQSIFFKTALTDAQCIELTAL
jgi:hypothetical protein